MHEKVKHSALLWCVFTREFCSIRGQTQVNPARYKLSTFRLRCPLTKCAAALKRSATSLALRCG